ncbi:AsmA family protein [Andreprevotia lacus DSM 23236]|jgi:uncharacterized protein involved in outer membrane biogenesis|uniref:AsmA family protein n=1 Tax=Andreprevotia lacus DSM 23236 TaxID=1121001 RepID=A0A1W1WWV4_9NEIS|nr:AsmA family protein [Andreprevotia lacus]SMC16114.1 AsmA family protein [Andreprevotia lacus DSM 23236]
MDLRHSRPFRICLLLVAMLAAIAGIGPYFFEADWARDLLTTQLKRDTGRTLAIRGQTRVVLLPRPAVLLTDVTLSEPDHPDIFAKTDSVKVTLGMWPLLSGRFAIEAIDFEKPQMLVEHRSDGSYNFEDLLQKHQPGNKLQFDLNRLRFHEARFDYRDAFLGESARLGPLDFTMDNLADPKNGSLDVDGKVMIGPEKSPLWQGRIKAGAAMRYHQNQRNLLVNDLLVTLTQDGDSRPGVNVHGVEVQIAGNLVYGWQPLRLTGGELKLTGKGTRADQQWQGELNVPEIKLTENQLGLYQLKLGLTMQSQGVRFNTGIAIPSLTATQQGTMHADDAILNVYLKSPKQTLSLDFKSPLELHGGTVARLPGYKLTGQYSNTALPRGAIPLTLSGDAMLDLRNESLQVGSHGNFDQAPLTSHFDLDDFVKPRYRFQFDLAKLDLSPYLPVVAEGAKAVNIDAPLDLGLLDTLNAEGELRIGELVLQKLHIDKLSMKLVAADKKLTLNPLSATLYEGQLDGKLELDASGKKPAWRITQKLSDMNVNTLLADVLDTSRFEGRGHLDLDIAATGDKLSDLKRTAGGDVRVLLNKGAIRGIDIEALLRAASQQLKAMQGDGAAPSFNLDARTRFSELKATMQLKHGVATNNDLAVTAGVLQLKGGGVLDLANGSIDYKLAANANPKVPELQGLLGLVLPIQLGGTLATPEYKIDYASLKDQIIARQKAEQTKASTPAKAAPRAPAKTGKAPAAKAATRPAAKHKKS